MSIRTKSSTSDFRSLLPLYVEVFLRKTLFIHCVLVLAIPIIQAHNGAVAYARPMDAVAVDGDVSEWPAEMIRYPMEKIRVGISAANEQDLSAHFRIGYTPSVRKIFIAVEVIDQSIMLDTSGYVGWDTHDGVELYLA